MGGKPCIRSGCNFPMVAGYRYCAEHVSEKVATSREAGKKGAAKRLAKRGVYGSPKPAGYDAWQGRAMRFVAQAVEGGFLPSLKAGDFACSDCAARAVVYDHRDYSRPLDVEPVCAICNALRGRAKPVTPRDFTRRSEAA